MRPWWGPFLNWLNSPQGWIFYALLSAFIVSILSNLVAYARRLRERGVERMGLGRLLAIMGGVVTLIALTILPWESYTSLSCPDCGGFWPGLAFEPSLLTIAVLVVGLLWFTFFGLGKKLAATLGFGWGGLVLLFAVLALVHVSVDVATSNPSGVYYIEYGVYAAIAGPIFLIVGSVLAYARAKETVPPKPVPSDLVVPPIP